MATHTVMSTARTQPLTSNLHPPPMTPRNVYALEALYEDDERKEAQRRERRRHRKRVARIVVEHWKRVSAAALRAAAFHRSSLLSKSLRGIKTNALDMQLQLRTALVHHHKRKFACTEKCLHAWKQIAANKRSLAARTQAVLKAQRTRSLSKTLSYLAARTRQKRGWRDKAIRAEFYRSFTLAYACLGSWMQESRLRSVKRYWVLAALKQWALSRQRVAFLGMKEFVAWRETKRENVDLAVRFHCGWLKGCFAEWRELSSLCRKCRDEGIGKLTCLVREMCAADLRAAIADWNVVAMWRRRAHAQLHTTQIQSNINMCRRTISR